jgi:CRP-like cAMP-binding protein
MAAVYLFEKTKLSGKSIIYTEGQATDRVYFIKSGEVEISEIGTL